jgi:hypothetical protein
MWMQLRAWWYLRSKGRMPRDVREYIIRGNLKAALESSKTPEQKRAIVAEMFNGALMLGDDEISPELRDELIKTGFERVNWPAKPLPNPPGS